MRDAVFTPRALIDDLIASARAIEPSWKLDPCAGTVGFLIAHQITPPHKDADHD